MKKNRPEIFSFGVLLLIVTIFLFVGPTFSETAIS